MIYGIYRVELSCGRVEYWKAPNVADLKAWLHDTYSLSLVGMLGTEIEEVPYTEAEVLQLPGICCDQYHGSTLFKLFKEAGGGCILLATAE